MKVSELTGAQLDYWVAKALAEGDSVLAGKYRCPVVFRDWCVVGHGMTAEEFVRSADGIPDRMFREMTFAPSVRWADGGFIVQQERIALTPLGGDDWRASRWLAAQAEGENVAEFGPTPLIAAMRTFVLGKFGEEVPDS